MDPDALTPNAAAAVETIGERVRRLRLERGLAQRQLAGPGLTATYVSRIENGDRRPSVRALRLIAARLGVSPTYLETGFELGDAEAREVLLADAELRLRLEGTDPGPVLEPILCDALAAGDLANAVRARIALGGAAAGRGAYAEAVAQFEQVIASRRVTPLSRPDVYASLGESYALNGDPLRAVAVFESVLSELERTTPSDHEARIRFSTYLSYALTDLGELERAGELVEQALALAEQASNECDPYTRVRLYWSLGRIAHEQSRPLEALAHFRRAVALLETTDDTHHLARAYLSCAAATLASGGSLEGSERLIEQAEGLLGANSEPRYRADARRLQAVVALRRGDFAAAAADARRAQTLAAGLPNQVGLATRVLAEACAGLGDDPEAVACYAEATRLLREHGTPREQLELLQLHASYLQGHGRHEEAAALLQEAMVLATRLQATARPGFGEALRAAPSSLG